MHKTIKILITISTLFILFTGVMTSAVNAQDQPDTKFEASIITKVGNLKLVSGSDGFAASQEVVFEIDKAYNNGFSGFGQRTAKLLNNLPIIGKEEKHPVKLVVKDKDENIIEERHFDYEDSPEDMTVDKTKLTPGTYSLEVTDETNKVSYEQDFTWGVLAINSNKSTYTKGETVELAFAVLNEAGNMVCDAKLELFVTDPNNDTHKLSTDNGDIKANESCYIKQYILQPDYDASFTAELTGTYNLTLMAETDNGYYTIKDSFEVKQYSEFEIERITATRIYPMAEYPVVMTVKANKDFKGVIAEKTSAKVRPYYITSQELKDKFDLEYDIEKGLIETLPGSLNDDAKTIKWQVDWKKGETYHLAYRMGFPKDSPELYLLGPLQLFDENNKKVYEEARNWQLAIDPIGFVDATHANNRNGTSVTVGSWTATSTNLLVLICSADRTTTTANDDFTTPGGWTSIRLTQSANGLMETFYKTSSGTETTVDCVLVGGANTEVYGIVHEYSGVVSTAVAADNGASGSGDATAECPSITPTGTNVYIAGVTYLDANTAAPALSWASDSFTERIDQQQSAGAGAERENYGSADYFPFTGSHGTQVTHSGGGSYSWVCQTIAFAQPSATDSWTGIAYTNEGTTPDTTATICAVINSGSPNCDTTDGSGVFLINAADASAGNSLTFYFTGGFEFGNTVTISDGGDIVTGDNLKVYQQTVMVRHEQGSSIAISDMSNFDNDDDSPNMLFTANTTLSVDSGIKFYVYSDGTNNFTFDPGNTVTTQGTTGDFIVANSGTAYLDTATNTIAGDLVASGSATLYIDNTTNVNGGDIQTTGTSASINRSAGTTGPVISGTGSIGGGTTPTLVFNALSTSGSGTTTLANNATVNGNLTVGSGTTFNVNADLSAGGDFQNTTTGIINTTSGTPTVTMTNNTSSSVGGGSGNITLHHLTTSGTGTHTFSGSGTNTINGNITVGTGTTLNVNSDISAAGNFQNTTTGIIGTSAGTPTVTFTGSAAIGGGSGAITFHHLSTSGSGTHTFSGSGTNTFNGNITVGSGTTLNINDDISVAGNFQNTTTGIIANSAGTPTVTFTGSATIGGGSGAITFYNLATSGTGTSNFSGSGTNTISNNVSVGSGTTLNLNSNVSVGGNLANTTTGIIGYSGTPAVTMTGTSNSIGGGSGTIDFYDLTIDPSSAGTISLNSDAAVDNTLNVATGDALSISSSIVLTHAGSTLTLAGTISGSGRLDYTSASNFPTGGSLTADLRMDGTSGNRNITDRTSGYGGNVELYSNSTASRTFTLGTGSSQSIDITGNLTLTAANTQTVALTGATHNPAVNIGGNISYTAGGSTESITTGTGTWTVSGDANFSNGSLTVTSGNTFQMNGASKGLTANGSTFQNFAVTGGSVTANDSLDVDGTFDVSGGATFVHGAGSNIDINIAGDFTLASGTTWTENIDATSQVTFDGDLDYADNNGTKQSIGNVVIGASPATTNLTTDYSSNSVTVIAGDFLNTCEYEMDIGNGGITLNTGAPGGTLDTSATGSGVSPCSAGNEGNETTINNANKFEIQSGGVFVQDASTVIFDDNDGTDTVTSNGESFYNLTIDDSNDDASLVIQIADALDVDNNLTITDGKLDANSGPSFQINVGGNFDNDSLFEAGTGLVVFDASSGTKTIDALGGTPDEFYDVTFSDGGSGPTYQLTTSIEADNDLTISGGTLDANGQAMTVQGSWNNSGGTFTANSNTVTFTDTDGGETLAGTMTGGSSFYNLIFNDGAAAGAWSFGANSATVANDFTITGGSVTAPSTTLTIAQNFSNSDSFSANGGTVVFNNAGKTSLLTYSTTTTFNNFTVSTANKNMQFETTNGVVTDINGAFTVQGGACGTLIDLDPDASTPTDDWEIDITDATVDVDYADISYSTANTTTITANNSNDSLNNTNWNINEDACAAAGPVNTNVRGNTNVKGPVRIK